MSSYIGINDVAHNIKKIYLGDDSEIARKVKKVYLGDKNGIAKLVWQSVIEAGSIKFTESTTWTVPDGMKKIDIFCCGGGGGAGGTYETVTLDGVAYINYYYYGSCGAGGYTNTLLSYDVTPGQTLQITVGKGGAAGLYYEKHNYDDAITHYGTTTSSSGITNGSAGGTSQVTLNGTVLLSAKGGNGGNRNVSSNYVSGVNGGSGSSSSGCRVYANPSGFTPQADYVYFPGTEGSDGGNGSRSGYNNLINYSYTENAYGSYGYGQGKTTRAFGEADGELYSTAGGKTDDIQNTGHGGGIHFKPYDGADGIVIIRWATQEI